MSYDAHLNPSLRSELLLFRGRQILASDTEKGVSTSAKDCYSKFQRRNR